MLNTQETEAKNKFVPETFWMSFNLTNGESALPTGIPLTSLKGTKLSASKLVRYDPAIAAFSKMIESLGGLESIKPGECMKLGTMGDFTINLYRVHDFADNL